ncbi:AP-1 complex accessory protein LAA1 [Sporobolomyces koalae]|uniref:AP-1 complex accessory protein LAA1 n=1 Tax=Sporobolomyces koalae TaxID=500713 RepID=UPI0031784B36
MTTMPPQPEEREQWIEQLQFDRTKSDQVTATQPDKGDLYLLNWLSRCELALDKLDPDTVVQHQPRLVTSLLSLILPPAPAASLSASSSSASSPASSIKPGRPIRHLISRIFVKILTKGDTSKSLFDLTQTLLRGALGENVTAAPSGGDSSKSAASVAVTEREKESRVACLESLGIVYNQFGTQIMSLYIEIMSVLTRIYKTSSYPIMLRYAALECLNKVLQVVAKSMSDQLVKDTIKSLRNGLSEKSGAIVRGSADCLLALSEAPSTFTSLVDIEYVFGPAFKAIELADFNTRRALSRMIAGILSSTQVPGSAPLPPPVPTISSKKKNNDDDDDDGYPTIGVGASAVEGTDSTGNKRTLLSPIEMLVQLSGPYNRHTSSNKLRNSIVDIYATLFKSLSRLDQVEWIETHYSDMLRHVIDQIGCGQASGFGWVGWSPSSATPSSLSGSSSASTSMLSEPLKNRQDAIRSRKVCHILLSDVVSRKLLSEAAQIQALRELADSYLKKWPSLLTTSASTANGANSGGGGTTKQQLLIALDETSSILSSLGCAPVTVQEALYDSLIRIVAHPSHSVQISASWALRTLCDKAPTRLSPTITHLVDLLNKDLTILSSVPSTPTTTSTAAPAVYRRVVGYSHALAALINLIAHKPLYVSFDLPQRIMSLSIQLLKQSSNHELHISAIEIRISWNLVQSLMSLGPNFVRLHLPQLLLLWRNALPKQTSKETSQATVRGDNEWAFLLHIREATLGAILSFVRHNASLVTDDISKRIVLLLTNGLGFVNSFSACHPTSSLLASASNENHTQQQQLQQHRLPAISSSRVQLIDREIMFRKRLFQCFNAFGASPSSTQPFQVQLLQQAVTIFADPDHYFGESNSLQAQATSHNFKEIWDETDGLGYGITSLIRGDGRDDELCSVGSGNAISAGGVGTALQSGSTASTSAKNGKVAKLNRDKAEADIEALNRAVILETAEHDVLVLSSTRSDRLPHAPSPAVGLVDAAIELFGTYCASQETANQNALLQILVNHIRSPKLDKNPGRKFAILANSITAVVATLRQQQYSRIETHPQVAMTMRDLIKECLFHSDRSLRQIAAESLGRLSASGGGTTFMAAQIQFCVQQVVSNTDPDNRAGCALAFKEIYSNVGSLAAGPVLKTIVDVLLSLSADPHPLVHFTALQSLSHVIDAASLAYAPFTNVTLAMLSKLYMQDTHEPEGGTPGSVNLRADLPAYQAICRVLDALIGVLGPELKESERVRELVLILLKELTLESGTNDQGISVEAIKATQHFLIFAPTTLDLASLVKSLRSQLRSNQQPLKLAAVNSVYQLVQRDAQLMSKLGGDGLVSELFALLDDDPSIEGVRDAIISWLRQTADSNPSGWIDLCQRIMSRSAGTQTVAINAASNATNTVSGLADEESQGLGLGENEGRDGARSGSGASSSRWRTQLFALECLHEVFVTVVKSGRREHFDIARARQVRASRKGLLLTRVSDLIKMAFTASTAQVMEIRLEGLVVLKDVIENFGQSQDIDFEEALLLDQFQAPIAAALTPAFAADSYPEVLASAIQVCAVFVGSGVVKETAKMGRILKLLTNALESCKDSEMSSLGDVRDLSSTAAVMLKTSISAAWAQFQSASVRQPYLADVIRPHLPLLCPFWIASLREYARVKTDHDASAGGANDTAATSFDSSVYSGLSRETTLPFYERAWPQMLHAVASLLKASDPHMLRAMDGNDTSSDAIPLPSRHRCEPALFFWVTFGLAFEALCSSPPAGSTSHANVQSIALEAIVGLTRPDVAGRSVWTDKEGVFDEVCNLCFRLALTEGLQIKSRVIEIMLGLVRVFVEEESGDSAAKNLEQCLRVATAVLRESIPATTTSPLVKPTVNSIEQHVLCTRQIFGLFMEIADALGSDPRREQLYAIAFHFFSLLLKDEKLELDLVAPCLPILKLLCDRSLEGVDENSRAEETLGKVLNGMMSACLMHVDETRGRKSPSAIRKTKNNLLAAVLILTTGVPNSIRIGREVVEHLCWRINDLALASFEPREDPSEASFSHYTGQLLPGVIELVATVAENNSNESSSGMTVQDPQYRLLEEVVKAFVAVLITVPLERRTQAMSILLPTLSVLLVPPSQTTHTTNRPLHSLALSHLLRLASMHSANFREATGGLGEHERKVLEDSIRATVVQPAGSNRVGGGKGFNDGTKDEQPRIELKLF